MSSDQRKTPAEIYTALRAQALALPPAKEGSEVYCVVLDRAFPNGVATLLAHAEGTVSMYFSGGGGMIGLGGHEKPRSAARVLLSEAEQSLSYLKPVSETPLPRPGSNYFYVLTRSGILSGEITDDDLKARVHPLLRMFIRADNVITEMRRVQAAQAAKRT